MPTMPPVSTNLEIAHIKPPESGYDIYPIKNGNGLRLLVSAAGSKTFQYRFRLDGKQNIATLGTYPDMQLADARKAAADARALVKQGINPNTVKREQKLANRKAEQEQAKQEAEEQAALARRFRAVAADWHKQKNTRLTPKTSDDKWKNLERHVFPVIGDIPIERITRQDLVEVVRGIEAKLSSYSALRTGGRINEVFTFAQNSGLIDANPATNLKSVLQPHTVTHRKMLDPEQLPTLLQELALDNPQKNRIHEITKAATLFTIMTAVRPGEARFATWSEMDLSTALWHIPAERMKMRKPHTVCLSRQGVALLERLKERYGGDGYIFTINGRKPISENTALFALQRTLRFDTTIHGFRSTFLTEAKSLGVFVERAVGAALSHQTETGFKSDAPYDRGDYLELRKPIMQWYSDWLEAMQKSGNFENPADYLPQELRRPPQGG